MNFFEASMDEFMIYCNIYRFIICKLPKWGKLSEKTFKVQYNTYTSRISSICLAYGFWLTGNTEVKKLHSIT